MHVKFEEERSWINEILLSLGAAKEEADVTSNVLAEGDLRGFQSHGIMRMSYIIRGINRGFIKLNSNPTFRTSRAATGILDGDHGLGHYVTMMATKQVTSMARNTGIATIGIINSNHFGIAGIYTEKISQEGLVGIIMASSDPAVHAYGGSEAVMGTNALSISVPNGSNPILLDMATSEVARGKIVEEAKKHNKIPANWALDSDGRPTTDPDAALKGSLNPFGGVKGYGISVILSLMAGPLIGAPAGKGVKSTLEVKEFCTKGDLVIAIDPEAFVSVDFFKRGVSNFIDEIKNSKRAPDFSNITVPGDNSRLRREKNMVDGYNINDETISDLREVIAGYGINCPF
jgi:L-2-hydroxycarboxylate dehydrogenase (NAD+)